MIEVRLCFGNICGLTLIIFQPLSLSLGTEIGSHYESGFYMTSFAATIFIGALVAVGILLITLLIALSVMLQSCQSQSSGVVEVQKISDDYNDCKAFALYAELNSLQADEFPSFCRIPATVY